MGHFFFLNTSTDTIIDPSVQFMPHEVDLIGIPDSMTTQEAGIPAKDTPIEDIGTFYESTSKPNKEVKTTEKEQKSASNEQSWTNPADVSMKFNREVFDFGKLKDGEEIGTLFVFTNTGKTPLEIDVISACYCMTVNWTRDLIQPGEKGNIDVVFDSNDQVGLVKKDIDIIFKNTDKDGYPIIKRLQIKGKVLPR